MQTLSTETLPSSIETNLKFSYSCFRVYKGISKVQLPEAVLMIPADQPLSGNRNFVAAGEPA